MGYAVYEIGNGRWGGYGVPAHCEYPTCRRVIDRGMAYACGGEPFSEVGCDRYFCGKHREYNSFDEEGQPTQCVHEEECDCRTVEVCERCAKGEPPFDYKPEHKTWLKHLLKHESWQQWRKENPNKVKELSVLISPLH